MRTVSITILAICLLFPFSVSAQSPVEKLVSVLGEERVEELKEENPERYDYFLFRMEKVYKVIPALEGKDYQELEEVDYYAKKRESKKKISAEELLNKIEEGSFNYRKTQLQRKKERDTYYELKGTGKILVLLSEDQVAKMYNAQK